MKEEHPTKNRNFLNLTIAIYKIKQNKRLYKFEPTCQSVPVIKLQVLFTGITMNMYDNL